MTPQKIDALQIILNNEVAMLALREVFDKVVKDVEPKVSDENDIVLGQKYRAYDTSKVIVEKSFTELMNYQKSKNEGNVDSRHI